MSIKTQINRIKDRFLELWKTAKIFKYAIILHFSYFIISLILVFTIYREQNDFLIYWRAGGVFLENTPDLYNQEYYIWDFRYFPLSAVFFIPFYVLGFDIGFLSFQILNLILNILISIILYKIIMLLKREGDKKDDKRVILYICLYLMAAPQILNYILGQINLYITFFILLSFLIFLKKEGFIWELIGSIILGISIILKPTALFIIPFLLIIHFDLKEKKLKIDYSKSLVRLIGVLLPVASNFIPFFIYPQLLEGFIATNYTGSNPLTLNYSFSITKNIINFCYLFNIPYNQLYILIIVIGVVGILGLLIFIVGDFEGNALVFGFTFSLIIMLLGYFDSWNHHLLNLTPLLIIILFNMPSKLKETIGIKRIFFFFNFFDIAFMGLWFLTYIYFPFNFASTIFLILTLYYIGRYSLKYSRNMTVQKTEMEADE
ncbi:MAG: glycosyltransferase 87 family protein [Candidatus Hodarchaeota archaeon]